jgi:hypothetical protein
MNRKGLVRGLSSGFAIVVFGCTANASSAQSERPYSGTCSTVVQVLTPPNVFPQELRIDLDCTLAHLGRTTGVAFQTVTPLGAPNGAILTTAIENATTYTAANGDMLDQAFIGTALINLETGEVRYIGTETFDGGTGRFNNATGTSDLTGTASIFTGTGLYTVQGRIAY